MTTPRLHPLALPVLAVRAAAERAARTASRTPLRSLLPRPRHALPDRDPALEARLTRLERDAGLHG